MYLTLCTPRADYTNSSWLANLGAILTIAALAVDPFSQQIIQSESCLQNITGVVAEIPNLQHYGTIGVHVAPSIPPLPGFFQAAIYMGLLSPPPNSSAAMTADCRTGNCTFPSDDGATFLTLAMCHSCVDISHTIIYNTFAGIDSASLQVGPRINNTWTMFASTSPSRLFGYSLFSFEALMRRELDKHTDNFAVACGITPCLKTFGANVTNGVYQERELSSVDLVWSYLQGYTLATNMTLRNGTWQSCMPTTQNTTANTLRFNTTTMGLISYVEEGFQSQVFRNMEREEINPGASLWYPDDCVWWFGWRPAQQMDELLTYLFNNKALERRWSNNVPLPAQGDFWLVNLYRNGTASMDTVSAFMDSLTWSMTAAMRQIFPSEDTDWELSKVSGQAQVMQSCLTVRWVWLSLPASLLGLQLAFLVAIVVISGAAEHWHGDWKDSSLALLYHGLEASAKMPNEKAEREDLRDKDGMFKVARVMKVQLRQGKDNWRFHAVP